MNKKTFTSFIIVLFIISVLDVEGRKTSRGRSSGSSRGSSRRSGSNTQPAPTSFSNPQASAPKPSLFGWQERPAQKTQTSSRKSSPTNTHSYPSSNTGLSGNTQAKQPTVHQENIQKNHASQAALPGAQSVQSNNHVSHSYPASNSLSGNSGTGNGYNNQPKTPPVHQESVQRNSDSFSVPAQASKSGAPGHSYPASNSLSGSSGTLSGAGPGYPQGSGLAGSNAGPPPYSPNTHNVQGGISHPTNNMGNNYNHAQGHPPPYSNNGNSYQAAPPPYSGVGNSYHHPPPPPPYSNYGSGYGGYGGHGSYNTGFGGPQMPGYFGNYGGGGISRGFGGVSRTSSALTGVGIAGAGVGTILTGLALWNLARSTGRPHHTVIYDNRGQPVAVAPDNNSTAAAMDSVLGDLVNCTLTISSENVTEVLAIPCAIATSFNPEVDVKNVQENINENDKTKCTITVVTKTEKEFMTTIPCSVLLNTAAQNNVTEPPMITNATELDNNATITSNDYLSQSSQSSALRLSSGESDSSLKNIDTMLTNCTLKIGETPDPINPCFPITHNLTVIPLQSTEASNV